MLHPRDLGLFALAAALTALISGIIGWLSYDESAPEQ